MAVFTKIPCYAFSYATYKYVKLCKRNIIANICFRKEVKNTCDRFIYGVWTSQNFIHPSVFFIHTGVCFYFTGSL